MNTGVLRVLVTAVGGDLGQAVVKALRFCEQPTELHGTDLTDESIGSAFVDFYHVVPPAGNEPSYIERLDRLCGDLAIDAIIPATEVEIGILSRLATYPELACGTAIVCQPSAWLEVYGDKLSCMKALEGHVALALYADGSDKAAVKQLVEQAGFPVVVKPRRSSGSRSLCIANDQMELERAVIEVASPIVQQYIDSAGGEFSVGVYANSNFRASIAFSRRLGPEGCSWFAETSDDYEVRDYAAKVADSIELDGSANIQVRKGKEGVRLLEINPRFSSLVAARAFCGFRDAEWSVLGALGENVPRAPGTFKSIRFHRFFHELINSGEGFRAVPEWQPALQTSGKEGG